MEAYGADINDRPLSLPGGKQRILIGGYPIPLHFKNGLAYLPCRKPTDDEIGTLPHVNMTSDVDRDPCVYENIVDDISLFHDPSIDLIDQDNPFEDYGSIAIALMPLTSCSMKRNSLIPWNVLTMMILLTTSWMHIIRLLLSIYTMLQLRMLCPNHPILSCFVHSLVGHRPTLSSALSM
jgi:hypothetical protein